MFGGNGSCKLYFIQVWRGQQWPESLKTLPNGLVTGGSLPLAGGRRCLSLIRDRKEFFQALLPIYIVPNSYFSLNLRPTCSGPSLCLPHTQCLEDHIRLFANTEFLIGYLSMENNALCSKSLVLPVTRFASEVLLRLCSTGLLLRIYDSDLTI